MNRALLEQGTGIALARREEIVFDAHRYYVDTLPLVGMEPYGFSDAPSFDNAVLDFDSRMLPEFHTPQLGELRVVPDAPALQDRYTLLTGIADAIELQADELPICAELLLVRPTVLRAALAPKASHSPNYQGCLVLLNGGLAS